MKNILLGLFAVAAIFIGGVANAQQSKHCAFYSDITKLIVVGDDDVVQAVLMNLMIGDYDRASDPLFTDGTADFERVLSEISSRIEHLYITATPENAQEKFDVLVSGVDEWCAAGFPKL